MLELKTNGKGRVEKKSDTKSIKIRPKNKEW